MKTEQAACILNIARQFAFYIFFLLVIAFLYPESSMAEELPQPEQLQNCPVCPEQTPTKDPESWDKTVALGFNYAEGNTTNLLANLTAKVARDFNKNLWRFETTGNYGESKEKPGAETTTTQKDFKVEGEYKRYLSERTFAGFSTSYLYDSPASIDYRILSNPSLGYFFIKNEDVSLRIEAGPSYVFEKLDGEKDDYLAPRIADRFEWKISDGAKFYQAAEYLINMEDTDKQIINAEAGIEAALVSNLSLVLTAKDKYDNKPAEDSERNDFSIISGLQWTF